MFVETLRTEWVQRSNVDHLAGPGWSKFVVWRPILSEFNIAAACASVDNSTVQSGFCPSLCDCKPAPYRDPHSRQPKHRQVLPCMHHHEPQSRLYSHRPKLASPFLVFSIPPSNRYRPSLQKGGHCRRQPELMLQPVQQPQLDMFIVCWTILVDKCVQSWPSS